MQEYSFGLLVMEAYVQQHFQWSLNQLQALIAQEANIDLTNI